MSKCGLCLLDKPCNLEYCPDDTVPAGEYNQMLTAKDEEIERLHKSLEIAQDMLMERGTTLIESAQKFCPECDSLLKGHDVNGPMCCAVQEIARRDERIDELVKELHHEKVDDAIGRSRLSESYKKEIARRDERIAQLEKETALARERLGPAGYKVLQEHIKFQSQLTESQKRIGVLEGLIRGAQVVHVAGADGERAESCCDGKHFNVTLMAGDTLLRVSYPDRAALSKARGEEAGPSDGDCDGTEIRP